jgi:hypothetical protein
MARTRETQGTFLDPLSTEVRQRAELEDPVLVGSLKLRGEMPIKGNLHPGEQLTVQVADADGQVIAIGIYEIVPPAFKDVKIRGVGVIGMERAHTAEFDPEG